MGPRSIRLRLTLWYSAAAAVAVLLMAAGTYTLIQRLLVGRSVFSLMETARMVMSAAPDAAELRENVSHFRAPDRRLLLYSGDGELLAESQPIPFRGLVAEEVFAIPSDDPAVLAGVRAIEGSAGPADSMSAGRSRIATEIRPREGPEMRLIRWPLPRSPELLERGPAAPTLVVLGTTRDQHLLLGIVQRALAIASLITLMLAAIPGYFLARRSLAPVSVMTHQAKRIGAENLSERLPVANRRDELGQLAAVLNDLLDRLQSAFQRQRQFMASAAHELRTPVAVVRGESELALSRKRRSVAEYQGALGTVKGEAVRMSRIIDDLLTLSRSESGLMPVLEAPLDLAEAIADTVRSLRLAATERGVTVVLDLSDRMPFRGDRLMLQRAFANLIQNAVRHSAPGTSVEVCATRAGDRYDIRVMDQGPGVSPDHREHIFEPFYRGDDSCASAEDSGAGLGLPIARESARAHQGDVVLLSTSSEGTVFQITLPAPSRSRSEVSTTPIRSVTTTGAG
jgi:heavy metal sensor kinase